VDRYPNSIKMLYSINRTEVPVWLKEDQTATEAEGDGFGAGRGAEFAEDGGHVEFGGVLGNFQVRCDLLVPQAAGQHLQNFLFAWSEWLE
jgi:hypothetical protein